MDSQSADSASPNMVRAKYRGAFAARSKAVAWANMPWADKLFDGETRRHVEHGRHPS